MMALIGITKFQFIAPRPAVSSPAGRCFDQLRWYQPRLLITSFSLVGQVLNDYGPLPGVAICYCTAIG